MKKGDIVKIKKRDLSWYSKKPKPKPHLGRIDAIMFNELYVVVDLTTRDSYVLVYKDIVKHEDI